MQLFNRRASEGKRGRTFTSDDGASAAAAAPPVGTNLVNTSNKRTPQSVLFCLMLCLWTLQSFGVVTIDIPTGSLFEDGDLLLSGPDGVNISIAYTPDGTPFRVQFEGSWFVDPSWEEPAPSLTLTPSGDFLGGSTFTWWTSHDGSEYSGEFDLNSNSHIEWDGESFAPEVTTPPPETVEDAVSLLSSTWGMIAGGVVLIGVFFFAYRHVKAMVALGALLLLGSLSNVSAQTNETIIVRESRDWEVWWQGVRVGAAVAIGGYAVRAMRNMKRSSPEL